MKNILWLLLWLIPSISLAEIKNLEIPLEMEKFKVEFYQTTQKGLITPVGCSQCKEQRYHFGSDIKIIRANQTISIETFISDYWNAKYPTIFLTLDQSNVVKVVY